MDNSKTRILYIHSKEIKKLDIVWGLLELGYDVAVSNTHVDINYINEEQVLALQNEMASFDIAFTQDFTVNVAEVCHNLGKPYISWIYDSPQVSLYTKYAGYPENFIFCFDKMQVSYLKDLGIPHVYYKPLAANIAYSSTIDISDEDVAKHECDISFIGQLYNSPLLDSFDALSSAEEKALYCRLLSEKGCKWNNTTTIYGSLPDSTIQKFKLSYPDGDFDYFNISPAFVIESMFLGPLFAKYERQKTLELSSKLGKLSFHTREKDMKLAGSFLPTETVLPPVYGADLYKAYFSAKLNLNITLRSIETGVPQRIFDIMSVGGTVISNYQEELAELFVPDKEIILFSSLEEYADKVRFLLKNDSLRQRIGINGYLRTKSDYSYPVALKDILSKL